MENKWRNRIVRKAGVAPHSHSRFFAPWTAILAVILIFQAALMLTATSAFAANGTEDQGEVPQAVLTNKPVVSIQGNVVVDNGKPTGFYELALCVRSARKIVDNTNGLEVTEGAYAADLAANPDHETDGTYTITYYPFASAAATVNVNTDALTAVNWDVEEVTYAAWDGANYAAHDTDYPRGIDTSVLDPELWPAIGPDAFPDVTAARQAGTQSVRVALDAEGDRSAFTAAAQVEDYRVDTVNRISTALVTLSAHAADNKPVVFTTDTPVVVVRFSYDLKRFPKTVVNEAYNQLHGDEEITGDADTTDGGFWLGLDRGTIGNVQVTTYGKTPLTWLANTDLGDPGDPFSYSDEHAAASSAGQTVWLKIGAEQSGGFEETEYYYYLGAENPNKEPQNGTIQVDVNGTPTMVSGVAMPRTLGKKVLTAGTEQNPNLAPNGQAPYTYFVNLLQLRDYSLKLKLVNEPTFKKATGTTGTTVLFYDWNDALIGVLNVGKGDVRAAVNSYVETNFIHPDLRASQYLDAGAVPAAGSANEQSYNDLVNSLDREFTYRGSQYPYKLNGGDALKTPNGDDYPLTNKLDYVFYKRLNLVNTLRTPDPNAPTDPSQDTVENYYTVAPVTSDEEAGLYPYIYGWAIVEDPANDKIQVAGESWAVRLDSVKTESTWTTFDTGELGGLEPTYTANGYPAQAIPAGATESQPGGLAVPLPSAVNYDYMTSTADANGYLRFADFSDMSAMLKPGQNVFIVKAVYEPGKDLLPAANYTTVEGSLYTIRYSVDASTRNAVYSIQYQYQRANDGNGDWQGVKRIREPAVQTGYTYDINEFDNLPLGIDQDLAGNRAFQMKTLATNDDIMDIDILTGGVVWKVDYVLRDLYGGLNVATGANRSAGQELDLKNGFEYTKPDSSGGDWAYDERFGTDSLIVDATITHLLTEATAIARGESTASLYDYFTYDTVNDLNLRSDMNGTVFTMDYTDCADYTQALVNAIVAAYPDPATAPAGIYDQRGAVTLTWHQLQRHIIMANAGNAAGIFAGGALVADSACAGFPWCRYDQCSADVKMEINNLGDLMTAIHYVQSLPSSDKNHQRAQEALDALTGAQLMGNGFRSSKEGVPYTGSDAQIKSAILDDLKAAYATIKAGNGGSVTEDELAALTWLQVQHAIATGSYTPGGAIPGDYWWRPTTTAPNGTPPSISAWEDILKYSYYTYVGVDTDGNGTIDGTVPDAFNNFSRLTKTQLDRLIKEDPPAGSPANLGWLRKGVDANGEAVEFTSVAEFQTAWGAAIQVLATGGGYDTPAKLETATWEEIQYALITGQYKSYTDILEETAGAASGPLQGTPMYWRNGGQPKLTLEKLLPALMEVHSGNNKPLTDLLKGDIDPINSEVYLRKAGGTRFASETEFRQTVYDAFLNLLIYDSNAYNRYVTALGINMTWEELQWLLIHYDDLATGSVAMPDHATLTAPGGEGLEYWWKDGGKPTGPMSVSSLKDVVLASYYYSDSETPNLQALDNLQLTQLQNFGIRANALGGVYDSSDSKAAFVATVIAAVQKLPYTVDSVVSVSEENLALEMQNLLLNGGAYRSASELKGAGITYWWQGSNPTLGPIANHEDLLRMAWLTYVETRDVPEAKAALDGIDLELLSRGEIKGGLGIRRTVAGDAYTETMVTTFEAQLERSIQWFKDNQGATYDNLATVIGPYQLQYLILNATVGADYKTSEADMATDFDQIYWWKAYVSNPSGPVAELVPLGDGVWEEFTNALLTQWGATKAQLSKRTAIQDLLAAKAAAGISEEDYFNKVLMLRISGDGVGGDVHEFTAGEFIANSLEPLRAALFNSDRGKNSDFFNTAGSTMKLAPTWEEFQYLLLHYNEIDSSGTMPTATACEAERTEANYGWRYRTPGLKVEYKVPDPVWEEFTNALLTQWGATKAQLSKRTAIQDLLAAKAAAGISEEDYFNKVLMLRISGDGVGGDVHEFTAGEFIANSLEPLRAALFNSDRGKNSDFFNTAGSTMKLAPTWEEFQYLLLHYNEIDSSGTMPTKTACEEEKTEANYEWMWVEEESGASLFGLDIVEEEPLESESETAPEAEAQPETVQELLERVAELERRVAELEERLAALEETTQETEPPAAKPVSTPARPAVPVKQEPTAEAPETPEETEPTPAEPEAPAETEPTPAPDHDEREEIPLGEEAAQLPQVIEVEELPAGYDVVDTPATLTALPPRREQAWKEAWV